MFLLGTLVNGASIIVGSLLGKILNRIPDSMKTTVTYAIGLSVMVMGLEMGFESDNFIIVILSMTIGAIIGELLQLEERLNHFGNWLESKTGTDGNGNISEGFVTAVLIFVIGAVGIIGALDSGIRGDHDVLFMKSIMDGFIAVILTTTLGIGVIFSAGPVVIYEGLIALFATQIDAIVPQALLDHIIAEITATGGLMIVAIGLNFMGFVKIKVANLLPGIVVAGLIVSVIYGYP